MDMRLSPSAAAAAIGENLYATPAAPFLCAFIAATFLLFLAQSTFQIALYQILATYCVKNIVHVHLRIVKK